MVVSGIAVNLTVSKGPQPVVMRTVPNVVGMTIANARSAVTSAGLAATFSINVNTAPPYLLGM
jgi:beta-lactam-binding protein with PASTA domain